MATIFSRFSSRFLSSNRTSSKLHVHKPALIGLYELALDTGTGRNHNTVANGIGVFHGCYDRLLDST